MNPRFTILAVSKDWRIVRVEDGAATVVPVDAPADADDEAIVQSLKTRLADLGHAGEPVVLAMATAACLSATVSTEQVKSSGRHQALAFRLEEHLPISAEDFIADYSDFDADAALGVCVELAPLKRWVDRLEAAMIPVRHITPMALLAAQFVAEQDPSLDGVLIARDGDASPRPGFDLVRLRRAKLSRWEWLDRQGADLTQRIARWAASSSARPRLARVGFDPASDPSLRELPVDWAPTAPVGVQEAAGRHAAEVLQEKAGLWIDWRRDALAAADALRTYRGPLAVMIAALVLLLAAFCVVAQWRGREYRSMAGQYADQQAEVFRGVMGAAQSTSNIKGRLLSERRKLAGLGGVAAGGTSPAAIQPISALEHLRRVLQSLPRELRFRVLDLSIQPDLIRVDGQALSHAEAEQIAGAVRQTGLYEVEPPKTESLRERGVSFVFTAKPMASPAASGRVE